jgi:hypothetical protein
MAVIKKTLFPKNLDNYSVLVNDLDANSKYFKITELSDTLTGGKNAFLIAGSNYLVSDTKIQIELKDATGNIIYHEPGEGYFSSSLNGSPFVTEYYEGVSKVVSVYIYPDTAYGPCTLTILGELNEYEDVNGLIKPIPADWENKYNVKWQKTINVNPSLANTTKIRFYQRPVATIKEILSPIYRIENDIKVNSGVSQSFADIKLSKLETFAGDVKRIKVFRTSEGDISDYDLIQDILVESKELLTSYGLTGSVVGQTGILTSETLKNFWNTGSLTAYLTSSRVESGVALNGSGNFRYTSSLDIKSANTYELNLDAFYSSSTNSNLGIYLSQVTTSTENGITIPTMISSSIATLVGTQPTKNLLDTVIPFKIDRNYPSASLYFSQSQGEWHLGNISLRLSQDTAFSPDEISFVTTMPTVIGNETYNFKFEFYDVNNNYVPVAVTQSLTFTGGVNVNNTLLLVSASTSQSLAALAAVSSSISGTMTVYSSSASSSVNVLSGSVSGTIGNVSSSISSSIYSLSGSVSSSLTLTSGSITLVSSSLLFTSQSFSSSLTALSASISSSVSTNASQSAYQVYSASQYLDKFIFTDANGKLNQPPTASDPGLYLGSEYLGYFSGSGTTGWKTYMDNQGDFYLTSSVPGGGLLAWDSSTATLQINGSINIQGGNAATTSALSSSLNAVSGAINSATSSLSQSVATTTFTTATGLIAKPPTVLVGGTSGLYLGSTNLGYYDGTDWKTYMANNGNFYLSGPGSDSLTWAGGVLTINGAINITGGNVQTSLSNINSTTSSLNSSVSNINSSITNINTTTSSLDSRIFTTATGKINKTPSQGSTSGLYLGSTFLGYYNGSAWKTYMDDAGKFFLSGNGTNGLSWDGTTLTITGNLAVGSSVPNTAVTGLGTLATQNTVTNTQVTGLGTLATANTVSTAQVTGLGGLATKSSVSAAEIDAGAVTEAKIGTGAVSNAKIAADAVTEGKIATDAVTSGKISANAIVAGKIAADAVTSDKIAAGSITAGKISAGAIEADKIAAGAITAGKISAGAIEADKIAAGAITAGKIAADAITSDKIAANAITAGKISANEIDASKVSSLSFSGKTATFDQGSVGGWTMDSTGLYKTTGNFTLRLGANAQRISISEANSVDTIDRVRLDASLSIPTITVSDTGSINWSNSGAQLAYVNGQDATPYEYGETGYVLGDGGGYNYGYGWGIVGLQYGSEEIFIESESFPPLSNIIQGSVGGFGVDDTIYGYWNCSMRVRKYPTATDAVNQTNQDMTYGTKDVLVAYREYRFNNLNTDSNIDRQEVFGATVPASGQGGINTPGNANWYRIEIKQSWYAEAGGNSFDNYIGIYRPVVDIFVKFGRVSNGYSVFSPGGLQVYQGVRNYMNASIPEGTTGDSANFFIVKGKSQIIGSLNVTSGFSANNKQFKIQHPVNGNKWLYHTSTEAPRADLIYRGIMKLSNGIGSASIDSSSNMTIGTFHILTKNPQLFLQNNESFDRVKGNVESGSIYVISENQNSTASIDWTVIAERKDDEILKSPLYDKIGNYKPERFKSEYLDLMLAQKLANVTGSI